MDARSATYFARGTRLKAATDRRTSIQKGLGAGGECLPLRSRRHVSRDPFCGERAATTPRWQRLEEHTTELQSLTRISYAVFGLKKKPDCPSTHNVKLEYRL